MKRITLLLLVASFLTITVSSDLLASSPVAGGRTTSVSTMLSHYLMIFVRAFDRQEVDLRPCADDSEMPLIGGDADDLADGRIDPEEDGFDVPVFDFGPDNKTLGF
ncbi:MAG: hypothetical protein JW746_02430 [Candidatus Krumholzibacteriota bacterium]|nr:hypothetical protein [Candidatus Krumholzibacteriota bacterium]